MGDTKMGCDIHCYIEYRTAGDTHWFSWGERINLGRNYVLFGLLAGVRCEGQIYPLRGYPDDAGQAARHDNWLYISDQATDDEHDCTRAHANEWVKYGAKISADGKRVTHPDWHSHSWLTPDEFRTVLDAYTVSPGNPRPGKRVNTYDAALAALDALAKDGESRVVFWFDN
ncbi:MAG: hypothetical protein OEV08_07510 [Nitrospira sp.]|nr:hypothetical protein [Nitrospira sp.]